MRSRCRTATNGCVCGEPVGDRTGPVGRVVVDHEHAVSIAQNRTECVDHRREVLALVVGRQADGGAHRRAYDRVSGRSPAQQRACGAVRAARRPDGARGRRLVSGRRLPPSGGPDPRDPVVGRAARLERQGQGASGHRQDDRGQDRRDRRRRRDSRADEEEGGRAGRGRLLHAAAGPRAEDRAADLAGARDHDRRRLEGGGRGGAAARARRHRRRHRGQDPRCARRTASRRRAAPRAARDDAAEAARPRRRPARASGCGRGVGRRLRAAHAGDRARSRHHRHRHRSAGARRLLLLLRLDRRRRSEGQHKGDGRLERRPALRPSCRPAGKLRQPPAALHRLEESQRRVARRRRPARLFGLGVLGHGRRVGRGASLRPRGGRVWLSRLRVDPPGAARGRRRAGGGTSQRVADAGRARRRAG